MAPFGMLRVIVDTDGNVKTVEDTRNNAPQDISDIRKILDQFHAKCASEKEIEEQKQRSKEAEESSKRYYKWERRQKIKKAGLAVGGVAVVVSLGWGATKVPWGEVFEGPVGSFDEHGYSLPEDQGDAVPYGETAHPGFSEDLLGSHKLGYDEMPEIGDVNSEYSGPEDTTFALDDGLRQIIITTSNDNHWGTKDEGKPNCETQKLEEPLGLDSVVYAWTDFSEEDGTSRADELDVSYGKSGVKVCWDGKEHNDDDDPRVVLQLQESAE